MYYVIKILISSALIVSISEISKRSSLIGGILASVPLVSFIAIMFLYHETGDVKQVAGLSKSVFWLVIPSLLFFVSLPVFLKHEVNFYLSMLLSSVIMVGGYYLMVTVLKSFGVQI